jgi:hypothetical protein
MEELASIINNLRKVTVTENLAIEDNELLSHAIDIYLFELGERNKDKRTQDINKRSPQSDPNTPTEKQLNMLKKFGYQGDTSKLTKKEASTIIGKLFDKKDAEENAEW